MQICRPHCHSTGQREQTVKNSRRAGISGTIPSTFFFFPSLFTIDIIIESVLCSQVLQQEQEKEMHELEKAMEEQQFVHEDSIRAIKIQFIKDQKSAEDNSVVNVKEMVSKINKVPKYFKSIFL